MVPYNHDKIIIPIRAADKELFEDEGIAMGVLGSLAGSWRCCRDGHINHPILSPDRCILDGHRRCRVCSASSGGPAVRPVSYAALRNTNLREEADLSPQDRFDPVGGTSPEELEVVENGSTEKELDVDEGASKQNYHLDEDSGYMELGADEGADWSPQDEFDLFGGISPEEFAIDQLKKDIGIEGPSSGGGIPKNDLNPESTMSMQNFDLINPLPRIVHVNQVNLPTVVKEILHRRFDAITQFLHDASITFVLRLVSTCAKNFDYWKQYWEPSLASGKIRIRWTCQCGKMLWDDFEELRPGAADSLRIDLDSYKRASVTVSKPHSLISQAAGSNTPQIPPPVHTTASILGSASRASIRHTSALISSTYSEHNSGTSQASTAGATLSAASPDENFLLLCSSKPNDTLRLSQLYVGNINDDVGLFRRLKEVYTEKRGTLTRLFSLRKLKSINFRKVHICPLLELLPCIQSCLVRAAPPRARRYTLLPKHNRNPSTAYESSRLPSTTRTPEV